MPPISPPCFPDMTLRCKPLLAVCFLFVITVLTVTPAQGVVLYDLSTVVLDGGAGENTYLISNGMAPPAGLAYNSATPSLTYTGGTNSNYTYMVGYFTSSNLVNEGDSITLSYSLTPSSNIAFTGSNEQNFRVGLYNSGGSKITSNPAGTGDAAFNTSTGYMATYRPRGTVGAANSIYQRTSSNVILVGTGAHTLVDGAPTLVSPGTGNISGSLTLTRVSTGVQIESVINGGAAQSVIDTSGLVTTFDTFSIFGISGDTNPTFTFSTLSITTASVPEPSRYLLLTGAFCALVCRRKRRPVLS